MKIFTTLHVTILLISLLLAAGCSGGGEEDGGGTESADSPSETTGDSTGGDTAPLPETTQEAGMAGDVPLEQIAAGSNGLQQPQVVVAPSADALSETTGVQVPDAGEGTYLAVFWGEKPTGGYTVEVLSARTEGSRIIVQLALQKPPPDAMVSQALTYPYAAAVLRNVDPGEKEFVFVTGNGREIGWSVRNV